MPSVLKVIWLPFRLTFQEIDLLLNCFAFFAEEAASFRSQRPLEVAFYYSLLELLTVFRLVLVLCTFHDIPFRAS